MSPAPAAEPGSTPDLEPGTGVSVQQVLAELADGAVLIDVRTNSEFRHGHAPMAINVQMGWLSTEAPLLAAGRTVITICMHGNRSSQAARLLALDGWRAFYVFGGLTAWTAAGERVISSLPGY